MMKSIAPKMGWLVAAVMGATLFASGFQDSAPKFGVVDITKAISDSNKGKSLSDQLNNEFNIRQGLLEFVSTNPTVTAEQALKLRELSVKPGATAADRTEIDRIKSAVVADYRKFETLGQKGDLSEAEKAELDDLGTRRRNSSNLLQRWQQEFTQELNVLEVEKKSEVLRQVQDIVQAEARKGGYTVVFESSVAIYGANDITAQATQALNASN